MNVNVFHVIISLTFIILNYYRSADLRYPHFHITGISWSSDFRVTCESLFLFLGDTFAFKETRIRNKFHMIFTLLNTKFIYKFIFKYQVRCSLKK